MLDTSRLSSRTDWTCLVPQPVPTELVPQPTGARFMRATYGSCVSLWCIVSATSVPSSPVMNLRTKRERGRGEGLFAARGPGAPPPLSGGGGLGAGARAHVVEAGGRKAVDGNQEVSGVDQARLGRRAVGCQVLRRGIERDRAEPQRLSVQICKDVTSDRSHGRRAPFLALSSSQGSSALKWRSRRTTGTRKSRALPAWATVGRREGGGGTAPRE